MLVQMGLCKGIASKEKMNGIIEHYLVLTAPGKDQFGQETEQSVGLKVSKRQLDAGIENAYKAYIGKQVAVPVYAKAWKSKTGAAFGMDLWLSDDGLPVPVQRVQARPTSVAS
ncbi:DNA-binding protein [Stutzerimonas chloritidismutans]